MATMRELTAELQTVGVSEHDAKVIADCIISRKSCSWVNTDEVTDKIIYDLRSLIDRQNYRIRIDIEPVPTRNKYIWEVKVEA